MKIIYSDQKPEFDMLSIFLAGPTYRSGDEIISDSFWRKDAIKIFEKLQFDGIVFVPELKDSLKWNYDNQVEWEFECLENCTVIAFWVPRDLKNLPAFTTNVEFGRYVGNNKTVYGRPENSVKNRYLDWLYMKLKPNKKPHNNLSALLEESILMAKNN